MADDQNVPSGLRLHLFEYANQVLETPEIDAGLRLIEDGKLRSPRKDHCDLNSFQLAAGKGVIELTANVIPRAQSDFT